MNITEKQKSLIQDLQAQEQLCIQKYTEYEKLARDNELKQLFGTIRQDEEKHYDALTQLMSGTCVSLNVSDDMTTNYNPVPNYVANFNQEDKDYDQYLCTDTITTEKYVSTAYNDELFQFGEPEVRKLLNDIQTEEQNHAEMIYKYKMANNMTN